MLSHRCHDPVTVRAGEEHATLSPPSMEKLEACARVARRVIHVATAPRERDLSQRPWQVERVGRLTKRVLARRDHKPRRHQLGTQQEALFRVTIMSFFLRLYTPLSNLGPAQLESRASHECAEALPVRDPAGPIYSPPRSHYQP